MRKQSSIIRAPSQGSLKAAWWCITNHSPGHRWEQRRTEVQVLQGAQSEVQSETQQLSVGDLQQCRVKPPGDTIQVHQEAKTAWNRAKRWPWANAWSEQHLSCAGLLELQSETHRHGNKGNNAASHSYGSISHFHIHYLPWIESFVF